jgi:hypothetical protein
VNQPAALKLSVVIPTRNRQQSLRRLLGSLRQQTLSSGAFEVIVVDDGSHPPLALDAEEFPFSVRIFRRDISGGAHMGRLHGLRAAKAARVLFLDDDVVADRATLTAHAEPALHRNLALGRTLYPPVKRASPFFRYMAAFYAHCDRRIHARRGQFQPGDYYICNSSGPKDQFLSAFADVASAYGDAPVGGEFDEGLLARIFAARNVSPEFAPSALLWHYDGKTLAQARKECLASGEATGRLMLERRMPLYARHLNTAIAGPSVGSVLRRIAMRCYWTAPRAFSRIADALVTLAEGPLQYGVPRTACHLPIRLARWEGMRRAIPSFSNLLLIARAGR